MHYNKKGQPFTVLKSFSITKNGEGAEYFRIKFLHTKHEQIVSSKEMEEGNFEDFSLNPSGVLQSTLFTKWIEDVDKVNTEGQLISGTLKTGVIATPEQWVKKMRAINPEWIEKVTKTDVSNDAIKESEIKVTDDQIQTKVSKTEDNLIQESSIKVTDDHIEVKVNRSDLSKIIATNPKGKDVVVDDLHEFCEKNKLDIESVQSVLDGKQKTHRKWRFRKA